MFQGTVCRSVCLSRGFTRLRCAKTAKRVEVLLWVETLGNAGNITLDDSPDFSHGFDAAFAKSLLF